MSIEEIPAHVVFICDRCRKSGEQYKDGPFKYSGLHIRGADSWETGPSGDTGGAKVDYDFCGECVSDFHSWLKIARPMAVE